MRTDEQIDRHEEANILFYAILGTPLKKLALKKTSALRKLRLFLNSNLY
jgi:hypothetical protein